MGQAADLLLVRLKGQQDIKESSKYYRRKWLDALLRSWPELKDKQASKITRDECLAWAEKYSRYSATVYNNTIDTLRMLFEIAIEKGARANNPALSITKKSPKPKELHLPSPQQFEQFIQQIEQSGNRWSKDCADLVRFLAYGGFRISEAVDVVWGDCDLDNAYAPPPSNPGLTQPVPPPPGP